MCHRPVNSTELRTWIINYDSLSIILEIHPRSQAMAEAGQLLWSFVKIYLLMFILQIARGAQVVILFSQKIDGQLFAAVSRIVCTILMFVIARQFVIIRKQIEQINHPLGKQFSSGLCSIDLLTSLTNQLCWIAWAAPSRAAVLWAHKYINIVGVSLCN